jgi:hypothetical protein
MSLFVSLLTPTVHLLVYHNHLVGTLVDDQAPALVEYMYLLPHILDLVRGFVLVAVLAHLHESNSPAPRKRSHHVLPYLPDGEAEINRIAPVNRT